MNIRLYNARIMAMEEAGVITEGEIWVCGNTITYVGCGKEKEEELKVDANKLQNPDYVARYAREKYLYSKEGEFILQIPEE